MDMLNLLSNHPFLKKSYFKIAAAISY